MKLCGRCNKTKGVEFFNKNKANKDGLYYCCKECRKKDSKIRYETNKEKINNYSRAYAEKNRDSISLKAKIKRLLTIRSHVNTFITSDRFKSERWKRIEMSNKHHFINIYGEICSVSYGGAKIIRAGLDGGRYRKVSLSTNRGIITIHVHKLMAITFLNHTPNGYKIVVDHIDNNRENNHLSNLQLITQRENVSKDRDGCSSKYTGVTWNKGKWSVHISVDNTPLYLGRYSCELAAAKAYQDKLKEIKKGA